MPRIYFSTGNSKLKECNVFSLMSGVTCKPGVKCAGYCYAKKAEKQYKDVRKTREENLKASKLKSFVSNVTKKLSKSRYKTTRIHEGGDYYSEEYIKKWYQIARNLPEHVFYSYTKRTDLFTDDILSDKPSNLKLILSIDGILSDEASTDDLSYMARLVGYDKIAVVKTKTHTCPSTSKNNFKVKCIKDCKMCLNDHTTVIEFARH